MYVMLFKMSLLFSLQSDSSEIPDTVTKELKGLQKTVVK